MKIGRAFIFAILIFVFLAVLGNAVKPAPEPEIKTETTKTDVELRGVWVSTVYCLDFPSAPDLSETELKTQLDEIVKNTKEWGLNAIFFQVHPASDALYESDIFPVSSYLTESGSLNGFDPLEYIISEAHKEGLQLHAWINPLRVSEHSYEKLPDAYKDYCVEYDGKRYLDPGYPEVRRLVTDCVTEITDKYHPDGVHFDDYFYPYPVDGLEFDDSESYALYGTGKDLAEYRRNNLNMLVKSVGEAAKERNTVFGVSPFGIWASNETLSNGSDTGNSLQSYTDIYVDSINWAQNGYVDYLCPQIYWSMTQNGVEFPKVCAWWKEALKDTDVKLYIGIAAYKVGMEEYGWNEKGEIKNQVDFLRKKNCDGFILFRYSSLKGMEKEW